MEKESANYLISYRTLRQLIGVLGILLPFLCWMVNAIVNQFNLLRNPNFIDITQTEIYTPASNLKSSVSHYYYTAAGPLFTGLLITVAIFLFCYKGFPISRQNDRYAWLTDKGITNFAAACALLIVLFPTGSSTIITDNIHIFVSSQIVGRLHLIFASLFFLSMALMSVINFRRGPNKELINDAKGKLFMVCGWGIIACLLILLFYAISPNGDNWMGGKFVFVMEVVMLSFFGTSWLTKGESIPTEFFIRKVKS